MPTGRKQSQKKLRVAVIGGGKRCRSMLEMFDSRRFQRLRAEIVGVADLNPEAEGLRLARERGIFTTTDCAELFNLENLDLVVELTDEQELLSNLAASKPESVGVIGHTASRLFHDVVSLYQQLEQTEDEASMARCFNQVMVDATGEGVLVLDGDYRIVRANQAALATAGLSREEALGRYCFQVSHQAITPCDSPENPCPMKRTLATGKSAHAIHEHAQQDGSTHYCDVSTYPLVNRKGEVVQVLELFRDITDDLAQRMDRRTAAIKADLARLVQEDKLLALGKLVASVAHEINNPISSIYNFVKLMHKGLANGRTKAKDLLDYQGYLDLCAQEAQRCSRIVDNLLSFARQRSPAPCVLNLHALLDTTVLLTGHRMELSGVELKLSVPAEGLDVWGDASQLQQVFTNLIFNALEAMPQGGSLEISGGVLPQEAKVWLEFRDSGEGIPQESLPRIFEPFFSTKADGHGVGLGLSMVYGIMREHHGQVEADSELGCGTTFRLVLPLAGKGEELGEGEGK
ncbi:MAG: PAS domain-containing protein [Proteobacteria bacterium]|nr:PAS domain-containing protein [Pseudomonadota bacterium]MBU1452474.1 PAS domain-containing protein [Pseudomonadota bacterium]MBU2468282.1 PAS domain-containing protein [Pseudomonadota bacterium]MBU2518154.1 PAS domain-containing protein [Pseudomonadota bacterium]